MVIASYYVLYFTQKSIFRVIAKSSLFLNRVQFISRYIQSLLRNIPITHKPTSPPLKKMKKRKALNSENEGSILLVTPNMDVCRYSYRQKQS